MRFWNKVINDQEYLEKLFKILDKASLFSNCTRKKNASGILNSYMFYQNNLNLGDFDSIGYNFNKFAPRNCNPCIRENSSHGIWDNTDCRVIHSEKMAILNAAKIGLALSRRIMVQTYAPCIPCAELIILSGIKGVIYRDIHPTLSDVITFLNKNGVKTFNWKGKIE